MQASASKFFKDTDMHKNAKDLLGQFLLLMTGKTSVQDTVW